MVFIEPLEQYIHNWYWDLNEEKPYGVVLDIYRHKDPYFPLIILDLRKQSYGLTAWRTTDHSGNLIVFNIELYKPTNQEIAKLAKLVLNNSIVHHNYDFRNYYIVI